MLEVADRGEVKGARALLTLSKIPKFWSKFLSSMLQINLLKDKTLQISLYQYQLQSRKGRCKGKPLIETQGCCTLIRIHL